MDKIFICPLTQKPCSTDCAWNTYHDSVGFGCCALYKIARSLDDIEKKIK
jgi:hypothetical protein